MKTKNNSYKTSCSIAFHILNMCSNRRLLIGVISIFIFFSFPLCGYAQLQGKRVIPLPPTKIEGFIILTGIIDFEETVPKDMADLRKVKMKVLALPDSTVVIEGWPIPERDGFFTLHKGFEKIEEKYLLKISAEGFRDTTFVFNSKENISKLTPMNRKKDYGTIILKRK